VSHDTPDPALHAMVRTCPRCQTKGAVGKLFGFRSMRGKLYAQSYCQACRTKHRREQRRKRRGLER